MNYIKILIRMKTLYVALAFILIGFASSYSDNPEENPRKKIAPKHNCNFIACDYVGLQELPEKYNAIDSVHFYNPSLTYDSCETIVIKNDL